MTDAHDHGHAHDTITARWGAVPLTRRSGSWSCAGATARGRSSPRPCSTTSAATVSTRTRPASSRPGVNPLTLRVLEEAGLPTAGLRSKSVDEYLGQRFDYVITVCDDARGVCPVFPGVHESLHWGYPDPAKVEGSEDLRLAAFRSVFTQLGQRIHQFLPIAERFAAERRPVELA